MMEKRNLLETLADHAETQSDHTAVVLINGQNDLQVSSPLTYHRLFQSAYNLAKIIKTKTQPEDRALLCYPNGIDFIIAFYGCLLAKVIAVPVVVPSNLGLIKKFSAVYHDCNPTLILTDSKTQRQYSSSSVVAKHRDVFPILRAFDDPKSLSVDVIKTDDIVLNDSIDHEHISLPDISLNDVAFLQYTSGSTSYPKGVMVTHGNLLNNIHHMTAFFKEPYPQTVFSWLPHTHDMGLIGAILLAIYLEVKVYLAQPLSFIRNPISWLQALSDYGITNTVCPFFALNMCLERLSSDKIKTLDLSQLKCLIVGSEPISYHVVRRFFKELASTGLSESALAPAYGLAESTLMVSTRLGIKSKAKSVSCGHPFQSVRIVSTKTHTACEDNEVGEIWLSGKSVARGYWKKLEDTRDHFYAKLPHDDQTYLRTGDLGFIHQGELYIVGRLKEVIIINGLNYYPQDIEQSVLACDPMLKRASCVVFRDRGEYSVTDGFVVLIKPSQRLANEVKEALIIKIRKQILKEYQLIPDDIQFVHFSFPKTTSGKMQRGVCHQLYKKHVQTSQPKL